MFWFWLLLFQIAAFAVLCLAQLSFGASYYGVQPYGYGHPTQYAAYPYAGIQAVRPTVYAAPVAPALRPEDAAAVEELGPEGVETGKNALNVAGALVKGVFPATGPIIQNGAVQTKWGSYALPNPQDAEIIEKFLQATRSMIEKIPNVE